MSRLGALSFYGLLLVLGCGPNEAQLRSRAAYDLRCPEAQLQLTKLDKRTRGVDGCGRRATYVWVCQGATGDSGCTWMMNTDMAPATP
jgi:hypothetical protein